MMKKGFLLMICVMFSLGVVFASGTKDQPGEETARTVTLKYAFWGDPDSIGVEKDIIAAFEKANPDIKIEPVVSPYDDYHTKLMTMMAGNMCPDVMRVDDFYFFDFVKLGAFQSLNQYITRDKIDMKLYPNMGIEESTVDGQLYGLPWGYAPTYMMINLGTFEKAGITPPGLDWTLNDFEKLVKEFNPKKTGIYGYAPTLNAMGGTLPFMWAEGGSLLSADKKKYTGDSPEAAAGIQLLADLYKEGYFPPDSINDSSATVRWFSNGTLAMMGGTAAQILNLQKIEGVKFEAWTMPQGINNKHTTVIKSNDVCISQKSKQKEASWRFLKFLRGVEGEKLYVAAKRFPPTLNVPENWTIYLDASLYPKTIKTVNEKIDQYYSHKLPLRTGYSAIESKVLPAIQMALLGTKTAEQALTDIRPDITQIIKQDSN